MKTVLLVCLSALAVFGQDINQAMAKANEQVVRTSEMIAQAGQQAAEVRAQLEVAQAARAIDLNGNTYERVTHSAAEQATRAAQLSAQIRERVAELAAAQVMRAADVSAQINERVAQIAAERAARSGALLAQTRGRTAEDRSRDAAERAAARATRDRTDSDYQRGTRSIDRRDYESAIQSFERVVQSKSSRADGALYWKAFAQNKLGRRDQALATLVQLQKDYAQSRWINDAKALEVEVKQASGQGVRPEAESDEDLKLLALNSLMGSDPERALPVLEKVMKDPKANPQLKERALFVMAQSRDPKARAAVATLAKGGGVNPDLQMKAVEFLGAFGKDNAQALSEIYSSTNDVNVRRAVIRGFMMSRDKDRLLSVVKSEQNQDLRREAIQMLGAMRAQAELNQLYQTETSPELRREIVRGMMMTRDIDHLLAVVKTEKDPSVRREAIHMLGTMRDSRVATELASLYSSAGDEQTKQAIMDALFINQDAKGLIEIARKETDPKLKRAAVERLSTMKSKEATDYMMEVLNK